MLLTSKTISQAKPKVKTFKLDTLEDTTINVTLLPASVIEEARELSKEAVDDQNEKAVSLGERILQAALVDDAGEPAFADSKDYEALPFATKKEICDIIFAYNGLSEASREQIEKN